MTVSGQFNLSGVGEEGAKITIVDDESSPPTVIGTDTTAGDGSWSVDVGYTTTVHCLAEYETESGDPEKVETKPFVHVESELPLPVGDPIHWWPMDEGSGSTVADNIGTNDGTITGATWDDTDDWVGDWALSGDGVDDRVDIGTPSVTDEFAIAFTVVHHYDENPEVNAMVAATNWADGALRWAFEIKEWGSLRIYSYNVSSVNAEVSFSDMSPAGEPTRIVGQFTGAEWEIYANGVLGGDRTNTQPPPDNSDTGRAIFSHPNGNLPFEGEVDDFIIYDGALTGTEIQDDYNRQPWS